MKFIDDACIALLLTGIIGVILTQGITAFLFGLMAFLCVPLNIGCKILVKKYEIEN